MGTTAILLCKNTLPCLQSNVNNGHMLLDWQCIIITNAPPSFMDIAIAYNMASCEASIGATNFNKN